MDRTELEATISNLQRDFDEISEVLTDDTLSAAAKLSAIEQIIDESEDESIDDDDGQDD